MADGNDTTTKKPVDQHTAGTPAAGADGHTAKLQADSQPKPQDVGTVKDQTQSPSDKALDRLKDTTEKPAVDSYTHLTKAQVAANEIGSYLKAGKKDTDMVTVKGADGKDHQEKVSDRVNELKKIVDSECQTSIGSADRVKPSDVANLLQTTRNERNALAKDLNVGQDKFNTAAIQELRKGTTDGATAAKLDQLEALQQRVDTFKLWENAPAYSRMLYASFKAAGLTNPEGGLQKDPSGGLVASQKDVRDAVSLLTEAGNNNKDLRNSRLYVEAVATVLPKLENSSPKVLQIKTDIDKAAAAGAKGDKAEQERLLKDAVAQADQTNTAAIAQMLRDPKFAQSQRNPQVLQDLATNVVMSSTARLQYAQFLVDQGKFGEAQGLALRVKTECPEVMYSHDPNDPTKLSYTQPRYRDLDQALATSSSVQPNQIKNMIDDFGTAMSKGQIVTKDGVTGAEDIIKNMYKAANKKTAEIADGQRGLDLAQKDLEQRKTELANKKYLTDEARQIEQRQLEREQNMIKSQKDLLERDTKDANRLLNVVRLYDAGLDEAKDDRSAAKNLLTQVAKECPELAAAKTPDGKDSFYSNLMKGTEEPSWWDRNWRKVAYAGAVVAGVAVGALTWWTGPGALIFGAGTTAALATTLGIGVVAGGIAGGATFVGTHEGLYHGGLVKEKVDVVDDFWKGAAGGSMGSLMYMGLPAMAGVGAISAGTEGATVLGTAGKMMAVYAAGSAPASVADYYATPKEQRSLVSESFRFASMTALAPVTRLTQLRNIAKGAEVAEKTVQFGSFSNLAFGTFGLGAQEGIKTYFVDRPAAERDGPGYAFDENGNVGPIKDATSPFSPYNYTRPYSGDDSHRKGDVAGGETAIIMSNWQTHDPGAAQGRQISKVTPATPVPGGKSEFSDADELSTPNTPPAKKPGQ